jgi:hypothetical protein
MHRTPYFCLLIGLLCTSFLSIADSSAPQDATVIVKTGFISGNEFRDFSPRLKRAYAMGFMDGVLMSPAFGAPKARLSWLESCVTGMTDEQVSAIFSKFLEDNPARWHEPNEWAGMGCRKRRMWRLT